MKRGAARTQIDVMSQSEKETLCHVIGTKKGKNMNSKTLAQVRCDWVEQISIEYAQMYTLRQMHTTHECKYVYTVFSIKCLHCTQKYCCWSARNRTLCNAHYMESISYILWFFLFHILSNIYYYYFFFSAQNLNHFHAVASKR